MNREEFDLCFEKASFENRERYHLSLTSAMEYHQINTPLRQAHFLGQICHESLFLKSVVENLRYSASGLLRVFPKYFTKELAQEYAYKPEKIASRVYANRYGNGDEESGDGWRYRGRGLIQITFRDNYKAVGDALDFDFINEPEKLQLVGAASYSATWFWDSRKLNQFADKDDVKKITLRINGGYNGLEDRIGLVNHMKKILCH